MPERYTLSQRIVSTTGPTNELLALFPDFRSAWQWTIKHFDSLNWLIVGCHLSPEFPHNPAYAEFFVTDSGAFHGTYVIHAEEA